MGYAYALAINLLDQLDPFEAARNSFMDYHAPGFDYLNLHRSPGLTVKIYMSDAEHTRDCGDRGYLVSPHDHGYNFWTFVVRGSVRHYTFSPNPAGGDYTRWSYSWQTRAFERDEATRYDLSHRTVHEHGKGESYYLDHSTVHTIALPEDEPTCMLLVQFADQPAKGTTNLYTVSAEPPSTHGLYQRPTLADINALRERARRFFR